MKITKSYPSAQMISVVGAWLKKTAPIYVAECTYAEKDVPKAAGFRYFPPYHSWWCSDIDKAATLSEYADDTCKAELEQRRKNSAIALESSRAIDVDVDYPRPDGLNYYPFQKAGIHYCLNAMANGYPGIMIGDFMGLGKTVQAVGVINSKPDIKKVLVVCPATLKENWHRELNKWLVEKRVISVSNGGVDLSADIVITNFEALAKNDPGAKPDFVYKHPYDTINWDLIIVDECHKIRNSKPLCSRAVYHLTPKHWIFLTGTPIVNKPSELFNLIVKLDPATWKGKKNYFMSRYCEGHRTPFGYEVGGANMITLPELQTKLRSSILIRRMVSEVLKELPAKTRTIIEVEPDANALKFINSENDFAADTSEYEALKVQAELAKATNEQAYVIAVNGLRKAISVKFSEMAKMRHDTAMAKVPYVLNYLDDALESVEKIVVFAHHRDIIMKIKDHYGDSAVYLHGECSMEHRQKSIDDFQNDPKIKIFVGSITAAGVGITLTAASYVVFAELDWVPANISQAESRCHRIGTKDAVSIIHIVLNGSLDSKLAKTIVRKQEIADTALDIDPPNEPVSTVEAPVTDRLKPAQIEKEALELTWTQLTAAHEGVRLISAMCNGARSIDGQGFSKIDVAIGHSLAGQYTISAKQAIICKKLANKYSRQLPSELLERINGTVRHI
jgi:SWI/SNF-related matrix-associated actin-dependent regulator 1 of chromatin subfamily A